ncbi:MAG: hypothetical protein GY854_01220 [Deltaproteobacteria bacterium]|nr:hypothetical protein [Deltaproteobacteria bacterium]
MTCIGTRVPIPLLALWGLLTAALLIACNNGNDDDNAETPNCSDDYCESFCLVNICTDAGLSEWGGCEGSCTESGECSCRDAQCHPENCDNWCKTSQQADGGICDIWTCVCS